MPKRKLLYNDERITIEINPRDPEGHILTVNGVTTALGRGVLEDIARASLEKSAQKVEAVNLMIPHVLRKAGIPYERLAYAIVKAKLEEEKRFNEYLLSQKRNK